MDKREPIILIEPPDGTETYPLQRHDWPPAEDDTRSHRHGEPISFAWDALQVVSADRSTPRPLILTWQAIPRRWRTIRYDLIIGRDRKLKREARLYPDLPRARAEIWHLFIGTTYYWKVLGKRAGRVVAESPLWSFTTNPTPPRWIRVPGITNVRDLGGWPLGKNSVIRQGRIFRSSEMNGHLQIADKGLRLLIDELGIRTDLDLRGDHEHAAPALDPARVEWIHAPISPYDSISDSACQEHYRRIFQVFADPRHYPILFHCVGGADRGGTVAFLLSALLGKDSENLMRDYELTTLSVWGERSRYSDQFKSLLAALGRFSKIPGDLHHQVESYLLSIGLTPAELAAIRKEMVADRSEFRGRHSH